MIQNVVFDLGRVIYTFWPREYLQRLGYEGDEAEAIMRMIFDNPVWTELDRGTYTMEEGLVLFSRYGGVTDPQQSVNRVLHDGWIDEVIQIMPESLAFYREVKSRGFKVYILSNFCRESFAKVRARDDFFDEADGMVISAHEGVIKPDRAIYELLLNRYHLQPEETVFIDDMPANIATAKALGINGIQFLDIGDCRKQFEKML